MFGFFSHALYLKKTVYGDGIFYFSWLRSIFFDADINFLNEYKHYHVFQPITPKGLPGNKYAVGTAILWSPIYAWAKLVLRGTGYELPYQLAVGAVSVLLSLTGLVLLYRLLTDIYTSKLAILATLCTALATNLLFYGSVDPVNSHGATFFLVCVYLSFLFQKEKNWWLIGASLGLLAATRAQDILFIILAFPYLNRHSIGIFLTSALIAFSPQLLAWYALYGTFLTNPYILGGEGFTTFPPRIVDVLFSLQNGLFLWTPVTLVASIGLFFIKRHRLILLCVCIGQLLVVSTWSTWWQGASFSGRMFVSVLPILAFGLATVFQLSNVRVKKIISFLVFPSIVLNIVLIVFYLSKH